MNVVVKHAFQLNLVNRNKKSKKWKERVILKLERNHVLKLMNQYVFYEVISHLIEVNVKSQVDVDIH